MFEMLLKFHRNAKTFDDNRCVDINNYIFLKCQLICNCRFIYFYTIYIKAQFKNV